MSLKPNETANELQFALRLTEISRWGVVATSRQQSVGEHSFRVCMIALAMYDYMEGGIPHNSFDRISIGSLAMVHDITEVLTGDLDSIFKIALKGMYPDAYKDTVGKMAEGRRDSSTLYTRVESIERSAKGTIVEAIVKLADYVEAIIYVNTYATNEQHRHEVRDNILMRMWGHLTELRRQRSYGVDVFKWDRIEQFINLVLNTPGLQSKVNENVG